MRAQGKEAGLSAAEQPRTQVLVIGGGVIGLTVAWRAAQHGLSTCVVERASLGGGASHVAAGMLAPVSEAEFGEAAAHQLELGLASARLWPAFAEELLDATGLEVGLRETGTLVLARDADEAMALERELDHRRRLDLDVHPLTPSSARRLEPALAPSLRAALSIPEDHSVDPRSLTAALGAAAQGAGARLWTETTVASLTHRDGCVTGVLLADGRQLPAESVVVAAGAWSGALEGLPADVGVPVRPVKGQILRLRDPAGEGLVERVLRFEGGYLVPRAHGRYVLGATVEEMGFDRRVTVGGMLELLREAQTLVPGLAELEIEEAQAGLRPGTPDNAPIIGPGGLEGLMWATGHHRNGILLAPLTGQLVADLLVGAAPGPLSEVVSPRRFGAGARVVVGPRSGPSRVLR